MKYRNVIMLLMSLGFAVVQAQLNNPPVVNPSFEDPVTASSVQGITDWYDSKQYTYTTLESSGDLADTPYGIN